MDPASRFSIARIEAVRPVPSPVLERGSPNARDNDTATEVGEFPGPARERHRSLTGRESENDVAERSVVAGAGRVERDVAVKHGRTRRDSIDDLRADLDLLDVRGRDRTEATGEARVLPAILCHMQSSASREGLRESRGAGLSNGRVHVWTRWVGSVSSATPTRHHQRQQRKSNSVRHPGPPFKLRSTPGRIHA